MLTYRISDSRVTTRSNTDLSKRDERRVTDNALASRIEAHQASLKKGLRSMYSSRSSTSNSRKSSSKTVIVVTAGLLICTVCRQQSEPSKQHKE